MPFLIAIPQFQTDELLIAFVQAGPQDSKDQGSDIRRLLSEHIGAQTPIAP